MFDKHRKRRIIFNDDGDQQGLSGNQHYDYHITDETSFLEARTRRVFRTAVDTYVWCVGKGGSPRRAGHRHYVLHPFLESPDHATELVVQECHANGLEVWGSFCMNDIHDSFRARDLEDTGEAFKAEHPDCMIIPGARGRYPEKKVTEWYLWTALDFSRPEVRDYRLSFIRQNAERHDFDGYELDFTRFVWNLPLGTEREGLHHMTDFVRRVRLVLDEIGRRRGRPYTLVIRSFDSPELALNLGLDVADWLKEGWVDVLVVGMGYLPCLLDLRAWKELTDEARVPLYASVDTAVYAVWLQDLFEDHCIWDEANRAASAHFWDQGAAGLYLFNIYVMGTERWGGMSMDRLCHPLLDEIGTPGDLVGKDKLYAIQPTAESGFCHHASAATPLPIPLDARERKLPLVIGPDAEDTRARATLYFDATGGTDGAPVRVRLNHKLLGQPERSGHLLAVSVPSGLLRHGTNELALWTDRELVTNDRPANIHHVFCRVRYSLDHT